MDHEPHAAFPEVSPEVRISYWLHFARGEHREETEFLLYGAKLKGKPRKVGDHWEGWNNVFKHNLAEGAAMRVLCRALKMNADEVARHETLACVHNGGKRIECRATQDFTARERRAVREYSEALLQRLDPDGTLLRATGPEFFFGVFEEGEAESLDEKIANIPREEFLHYYVDSIFVDGTIVPALTRIAQTEERRGDLNADPERTRRLGMQYWDAERLLAQKAEGILWQWLQENGTTLGSPALLPDFIRGGIEREMVEHWRKTHPSPHTVVEWRERFDEDPQVDRRAIARHVECILRTGTMSDRETFILIDQCRTWHAEYCRVMAEKRLEAPSSNVIVMRVPVHP